MMQWIETQILPIIGKISNQRHLSAVRDGLVATIPLTIIGALFLLVACLPWPHSYVIFLKSHPEIVEKLFIPFNMSMGLLSLYVSYAIGSRLAKSYELDSVAGGIAALFTFLMTLNIDTSETLGQVLKMQFLGGAGIFGAILTAILAIEIFRLCKKYHIGIHLPKQVPPNVGSSFESLVPITFSVLLIWIIVHLLGVDINQIIHQVVTPLLSVSSNSIFAPLIYVMLTCILWFFGIHPQVLFAIMLPVWLVNADANMAAAAAGTTIPNIGVQPFIFTFLWIGGGGGTLALCAFMCFSKSKVLKSLGRLSIIPGIFNINEPLLFGVPLVLNPILFIPFFIAPIIMTFVTYFAFVSGIVPPMAYPTAAVWTIPSFIAGALVTSSIRGGILVVINLMISGCIYYPFFKMYEKKLLLEENQVLSENTQ